MKRRNSLYIERILILILILDKASDKTLLTHWLWVKINGEYLWKKYFISLKGETWKIQPLLPLESCSLGDQLYLFDPVASPGCSSFQFWQQLFKVPKGDWLGTSNNADSSKSTFLVCYDIKTLLRFDGTCSKTLICSGSNTFREQY